MLAIRNRIFFLYSSTDLVLPARLACSYRAFSAGRTLGCPAAYIFRPWPFQPVIRISPFDHSDVIALRMVSSDLLNSPHSVSLFIQHPDSPKLAMRIKINLACALCPLLITFVIHPACHKPSCFFTAPGPWPLVVLAIFESLQIFRIFSKITVAF